MQIIYSTAHRLHNTDQITINGTVYEITEVPARVEVILQSVENARLGCIIEPSDHGLAPIQAIHQDNYLHYLQTIYDESAAKSARLVPVLPETFAPRHFRRRSLSLDGRKGYYAFGTGSPILAGTWIAAYWSAQCAITGAKRLLAGEPVVYALCRPPGHHAMVDQYGGYCYINNAVVAARFLLTQRPEFERVAILDIDYHHGNGTQEIFYTDPQVLYCSLHAHPDDDYPYYWGAADERGEGAGMGYNLNYPLPQGIGDQGYLKVLDRALEEVRHYNPLALIVSLGMDIAEGDTEGGFKITTTGFQQIGLRIASLYLPTLLVQEGGYDLSKVGINAVAFLQAWS